MAFKQAGAVLEFLSVSAHTEPPPAYCKTNIGAGEQGWRPMTESAARSLLHLPPKVRERQGVEEGGRGSASGVPQAVYG